MVNVPDFQVGNEISNSRVFTRHDYCHYYYVITVFQFFEYVRRVLFPFGGRGGCELTHNYAQIVSNVNQLGTHLIYSLSGLVFTIEHDLESASFCRGRS